MTRSIDDATIARWRLRNQRLTGDLHGTIGDTVGHLLCVQAENHAQASWAVACRSRAGSTTDFDEAFDRGDILRTHVLRPTWHYATPADIGWLLDLTGPRIWPSRQRLTAQFGVDPSDLVRAAELITSAIETDGPLRRAEISERLAAEALPSEGQPFGLALEFAEVEGLICSGPIIDGDHSHALLAQRAPATRRLDRGTAIAELTLRYLTSHGPATEADLAYWSSLTLTDARAGIGANRDDLASFDHDGRTYWHRRASAPPHAADAPRAHILQILDESYRGYQDSRWALDAANLVARTREKTIGMVLIDAQIAAGMRRTVTADCLQLELSAYRNITKLERHAVTVEAQRYGRYLGVGTVRTNWRARGL